MYDCACVRENAPVPAQGRKNHCVAVIGDGAITGGMAYEAMNHAGFLDKNMIVVLNDNQQVLDPGKPLKSFEVLPGALLLSATNSNQQLILHRLC